MKCKFCDAFSSTCLQRGYVHFFKTALVRVYQFLTKTSCLYVLVLIVCFIRFREIFCLCTFSNTESIESYFATFFYRSEFSRGWWTYKTSLCHLFATGTRNLVKAVSRTMARDPTEDVAVSLAITVGHLRIPDETGTTSESVVSFLRDMRLLYRVHIEWYD